MNSDRPNTAIEDLIRQALELQADRAADPDQILAALPARAVQRTRYHLSGLLAAAAAAAVVTAIAVPTLAAQWSRHGGAGPGAGGTAVKSPSTIIPPSPGTPPIPVIGMRYRPTWLPSGLAERSRVGPLAVLDGGVQGPVRTWTKSPVGPSGDLGGARLELYVTGKANAATEGTRVDVNGRPGYIVGSPGDGKSYLSWMPDRETVLSVAQHRLDLSGQDLLKIAESVRTDTATLAVPLRIGWLPKAVTLTSADTVGDSATSWRAGVMGQEPAGTATKGLAAKRPGGGPRTVEISVGTAAPTPMGGERSTINGFPARTIVASDHGLLTIVMDLGRGRWLTVLGSGPWSTADLARVAQNVQVTELPELSWLGAR